ncbi:MAG TPA: MarR family EPS-associated transcriptional regulator [Burkholderiales bacterium]|nr:MarR family EPS-associated transcriptional regulator [Burkholderiales bacterium]
MLDDDTRYRLLKRLQENPEISQRQLAGELGVSVGKVNFCLRALLDKGLVKVRNFRDSRNKLAYAYYLTPKGAREKVRATSGFLMRKLEEYEGLQRQIDDLRREVQAEAQYPNKRAN